jgi:hypothetical protein
MKKNNILILLSLLSLLAACVPAQKPVTPDEQSRQNKQEKTKKEEKVGLPDDPEAPPQKDKKIELKEAEVLAKGQNSGVEEPFIYIARTKEDLAIIRSLAGGFSVEKEIDFTKQAVIAAFAGTKNTGGYTLSIYQLEGITHVLVKNPPEDAFVTQALTQPFEVGLISLDEEEPLELAVSDEFKNGTDVYEVTSGEFEFSGGFAGIRKNFRPEGTIRVLKWGGYVTFIFDLKGTGDAANRILSEYASGKLNGDQARLNRLEAGNFIDRPHPPLKVFAEFEGDKLSMKFTPGKRGYVVNDGFEGSGKLEAVRR